MTGAASRELTTFLVSLGSKKKKRGGGEPAGGGGGGGSGEGVASQQISVSPGERGSKRSDERG